MTPQSCPQRRAAVRPRRSAVLTLLASWLFGLGAGTTAGAAEHTLKFATLAPPGTTWSRLLEDWGRTLALESDGRLRLQLYAGGVQGDEPDVLRKMRFNQLQGGAFTGYGIGQVYPAARVLELPFLYQDSDEVDQLRSEFGPELEAGFREAGYELLGWMEVGPVHFLSRRPITSLADLRTARVWLWSGDVLSQVWFDAAGIQAVPLSITDVYTSLASGLIDTAYTSPLAAVALQWFTRATHMTQVPMAQGMGALLVSRRFFQGLPSDLQALLRRSGRATGEALITATRRDNRDSLAVLAEAGIRFQLRREDLDPDELRRLQERAEAELVARDYIPEALFQRVLARLQALRAPPPGAGGD